jgi:hypothetical protein
LFKLNIALFTFRISNETGFLSPLHLSCTARVIVVCAVYHSVYFQLHMCLCKQQRKINFSLRMSNVLATVFRQTCYFRGIVPDLYSERTQFDSFLSHLLFWRRVIVICPCKLR